MELKEFADKLKKIRRKFKPDCEGIGWDELERQIDKLLEEAEKK